MNQAREAFSMLSAHQLSFLNAVSPLQLAYLVVGGFAVRYHNCPRLTQDLDVFVERTESNVDDLILVMSQLGATNLDRARDHLLRTETQTLFHDVELFSSMRGLEFQELFRNRVIVDFQGLKLSVISIHHLKITKRLALQDSERAQRWHIDRQDLECLEKQNETTG